jgi:hypothetical protein
MSEPKPDEITSVMLPVHSFDLEALRDLEELGIPYRYVDLGSIQMLEFEVSSVFELVNVLVNTSLRPFIHKSARQDRFGNSIMALTLPREERE